MGVSITKYEQCTGTSNHNVIRESVANNETQAEAVQVYPNPFQGSTNIGVSVTEQSTVAVEVFNAQGVKLETIFSGMLEAGKHAYQFNAKHEGMYYLRTTINKKTYTNKLILLGGN